MKTTLKNFYQTSAPCELKPGNVYPFHIPHVHFDEMNSTLNVVFSLKNEETGRTHYLLDTFKVDSERYWALIEEVYSDELSWGMVIAIDFEDLTRFWGECALTLEEGRLVVDLDFIEAESKPFSHIWEEQCEGVGFWKCNYHPETYEFESVKISDPSYREASFLVQPDVSHKLKTGTKYAFTVKKCHMKAPNTIQIVLSLLNDDDEYFWFLDEFEIDSPRFNDFVSNAYSVDVDHGMVVEFDTEALCDVFSGRCELEEHDGKLRINWTKIDLEETLMSAIFDEQEAALKGGDE